MVGIGTPSAGIVPMRSSLGEGDLLEGRPRSGRLVRLGRSLALRLWRYGPLDVHLRAGKIRAILGDHVFGFHFSGYRYDATSSQKRKNRNPRTRAVSRITRTDCLVAASSLNCIAQATSDSEWRDKTGIALDASLNNSRTANRPTFVGSSYGRRPGWRGAVFMRWR